MSDQLEIALALLTALVSDEICTFDHNGWCQTHYRDPVFGQRCANEEAQNFLRNGTVP